MRQPPAAFPFYPLSSPKGVEYTCEVCSKPAYLQCGVCRVTYYCGIEHQKVDWVGIHEKICLDLISFRKPEEFVLSKDGREKKNEELQRKNLDMVQLTHMEGQKLLFQGKSEEAVPAALQCLRFTVRAYGTASIELVSPYLILAESSIGLGILNEAEAYLAQAQWIVLKAKNGCSNGIQSQLNRKLALLYAAKGNFELALESLAKDIFYASLEYGTDHIRTAGGYFQMAEVFHTMSKLSGNKDFLNQNSQENSINLVFPSVTPEFHKRNRQKNSYDPLICEGEPKWNASFSTNCIQPHLSQLQVTENLYARVVDIWAKHLSELVESLLFKPVISESIDAVVTEITQETKSYIDDAQKAEAEKMLYAIEKYRHQCISENESSAITCNPVKPDPKIHLYLTLSMLNYVLERKEKSLQYLTEAKVAAEFIVQHPKITASINLMERALYEKK
ncbi:unnamed protein product [Schistosoma turkestanicum]|nr:unnamed protein product [Schistosoma turkestanicum]